MPHTYDLKDWYEIIAVRKFSNIFSNAILNISLYLSEIQSNFFSKGPLTNTFKYKFNSKNYIANIFKYIDSPSI